VTFPVSSFLNPSVFRHGAAFARWCRREHIAVAHTTGLGANIFGLPAAAAAGVPVRIGNRREISPDKGVAHLALQRAAYACAHMVVANSSAARRRLIREGVRADRIGVVANGIDVSRFGPSFSRTARRRIAVVANLRPEKGHDVLIRAAAALVGRFPDAHVDVIGDGPCRAALEAHVARRGLVRAFTFWGHREDIAARLAAADIFVLPSRSDACPNAVLEAMAAGLPIVASRTGGIPELIEDGRTGLLTDPDNAQALCDQLCRLMEEPSLGEQFGRAARTDVETRYTFDRMIAGFEAIYLAALGTHARRSGRLTAVGA
jgi:glycosyltransferase involved in cell wall biosynthesis